MFRRAPIGLFILITGIAAPTGLRGEDLDLGRQVKLDSTPLPKEQAESLSYASVVEKCLPSVVTVLVTKDEKNPEAVSASPLDLGGDEGKHREAPHGSGSGVILTANGYLLTNNHVIENALTIRVRLPDKEGDLEAKLIGCDPMTDVALLKIEATGLPPITIADSTAARRGDVVLALGSPFGLEQTVTKGIISATGRTMGFIRNGYEDYLQTDAAINPGNSGGALVDGLGRLVGINTARYVEGMMPAQGIGFAIPSNLALRVAGDLLRFGRVVRGYMGVQWVEVSEEEALKITGRADMRPARIVALEAGTPAEKAGFEGGDVVLSLNGNPTPTLARARFGVATLLPGSKAVFTVLRGKEKHTVEVTLIEARFRPLAAKKETEESKSQTVLVVQDGFEVAPLTRQARLDSNLPAETEGVLVMRAEEGGKLLARLGPGDVIFAVNGQTVQEPDVIRSLFVSATPGKAFTFRVWHKGAPAYVVLHKK